MDLTLLHPLLDHKPQSSQECHLRFSSFLGIIILILECLTEPLAGFQDLLVSDSLCFTGISDDGLIGDTGSHCIDLILGFSLLNSHLLDNILQDNFVMSESLDSLSLLFAGHLELLFGRFSQSFHEPQNLVDGLTFSADDAELALGLGQLSEARQDWDHDFEVLVRQTLLGEIGRDLGEHDLVGNCRIELDDVLHCHVDGPQKCDEVGLDVLEDLLLLDSERLLSLELGSLVVSGLLNLGVHL